MLYLALGEVGFLISSQAVASAWAILLREVMVLLNLMLIVSSLISRWPTLPTLTFTTAYTSRILHSGGKYW